MNIDKSLINYYTASELNRLLRAFPFDTRRIELIQLKKLRKILIHAYRNFDFYRERMDRSGLNPFQLRDTGEISRLPILTEAEYREFANAEFARAPSRYQSYYFDTTSGTVGMPFRIVRTWPERGYMIAKYLRALFLNGLRWNDRIFRIIPPFRIPEKKDTLLQHLGFFRRDLLSFCASAEEMALAYCRSRPDFFYTNKQQLLMTARHLLEKGMRYEKPRIYSAGAEMIDENCRRLFYRAFGKDNFFETYGSNELGNLAFQIKGTDGLYFSHDTSILEIQAEDGSVAGDKGNCLVTELGIFSFPMIRFQLGDFLETGLDENGIRRIRKILGRLHDWVSWEDGSRTRFSEFFRIMESFAAEICQFQIIQESFTSFRIKVVSSPGNRAADEAKLKRRIPAAFKKGIQKEAGYQVEFVPAIAAEVNGKVKMVIRGINP